LEVQSFDCRLPPLKTGKGEELRLLSVAKQRPSVDSTCDPFGDGLSECGLADTWDKNGDRDPISYSGSLSATRGRDCMSRAVWPQLKEGAAQVSPLDTALLGPLDTAFTHGSAESPAARTNGDPPVGPLASRRVRSRDAARAAG